MKSDLVLHGARVLTMNPRRPRAALVAIRGRRIFWVGEDLERVRDGGKKTICCEGKALLPAFIDAHFHLFAYVSSLLSLDCSPPAVASLAQVKEKVRRRAREIPPGSWVRASGYDEFSLLEKRHPTRWDLDEAAPSHPVRLLHRSLHASVLNSLALSRAGITRETPDPIKGLIDRDETGEPTGLLFGMNTYLTEKVVPPLSEAELGWGMERASRHLLSWGIASIQDATASNSLSQWEALRRLKREGKFAPRVTMMIGFS
ncbi:MAG: amidohydrolase family protein, partial [Chloroflexota bacterium]|nr:amidohydrolase family protein [Chloroflexota bacterium]